MRNLHSSRRFRLGVPRLAMCGVLSLGLTGQTQIFVNATPNDGVDDTAAIAAAFAAAPLVAAVSGSAEIVFQSGTYDLFLTAPPQMFTLLGANNVTISGNGAKLLLHKFNPMSAPGQPGAYAQTLIKLQYCSGVTVRGLTVDMVRQPYSSGTIIAKVVGPTGVPGVTLRMDRVYGDIATGVQIQRMDDIHATTGALESQHFTVQVDSGEYATGVALAGGQQFLTIFATPQSQPWFVTTLQSATIGERLVVMHSKYRTSFVLAIGCSGLTVDDVTLQAMPGMGLIAFNCHDVTVNDFDLEKKAGRLMSITADGVNLSSCTGNAVMQNCDMQAMGDDGLNVHGKYVKVTGVTPGPGAGATIDLAVIDQYWLIDWTSGQQLTFSDNALQDFGTATITSFLVTGGTTENPQTMRVTTDADPGIAVGNMVVNTSKVPSIVTVTNCKVTDNIARGLKISSDNVMVSQCEFRRNTSAGILIEADAAHYFESKGVRNVTVGSCLFDDCNRYAWESIGAISISANYLAGPIPTVTIAPVGVHSNIYLSGNTISNLSNATTNSRSAIWVTSASSVSINDTTFTNINQAMNLVRVQNAVRISMNDGNCASGFTGVKVFPAGSVQEPTVGPPCW